MKLVGKWVTSKRGWAGRGIAVISCGCTIACGGAESEESVATTSERVSSTFQVAGVGTSAPERGTTLPGRSPGIPNVVPPRATAFGTPIVNRLGLQTTAPPPDPIGDVGPNHYVQGINGPGGSASFTIYDKAGTPLSANHTAVPIASLVTTSGPCANGFSDPVVNYDALANRWIVSQIALAQALCVYISDTGDPAALDQWTLYTFDLSALVDLNGNPAPGQIPDYPKIAVWPDAYYVTANDFAIRANEAATYALERDAMLAGTSARVQRFVVPNLPILSGYQPMSVVDLDGRRPPPAGTPGMVVRRADDEFFATPGNTPNDTIEIWDVSPDFATPANSTLVGPTSVVSADTDANICSPFLFNDCAAQPGTTQLLSVLGTMVGALWRVQYRNFGTHETMVGNFDADGGVQQPATHWFELRRSPGGAWAVNQEQTYAPTADHRWMGSTAMDGSGNLAHGYSISSSTIFPSVNYAGRRATDPLGALTTGETTLAAGLQSQSGVRWGDYSSMNVDPVDDCTFWYTNIYFDTATAGSLKSARFGAFGFPFPECFPANAQCVRATQSLLIRDRARVLLGSQTIGAIVNSGTGVTDLGVEARTGDVLSVGNVFLRDRSLVTGIVRSQGSVFPGNNVVVTGGITANTSLTLPPPLDISDVVFPAPGPNVTVSSGQIASRAPGSYGQVTVFTNGRLRLTAGTYFFTGLQLEPQSILEVDESAGPVLIFVSQSIIYRGRIAEPGGATATVFLGYTGTNAVFLEAPFNGTLVAPNANLTLGAGGFLQFRGQFVARTYEQRPDVFLTCDTSASNDLAPPGTPPAASCTDAIQNGSETDVDCGGGVCPDCPNGDTCSVNGDCQSNNCVGGVCQPLPGAVTAVLTIPGNWAGGYCAVINVTNNSTQPTTTWSVSLNTNQATIYTSWNGNFSGASGSVNVSPAFTWNQVIAPGATNNSVGFCANRNVSGSGTLPFVLSASGSF